MKNIKYLLIVVLVVLGLLSLLPSQFDVAHSIEIEGSQEDVYSYLVNLESWPEWNPWLAIDPETKVTFSGIPGIVGSAIEWDGEKTGKGRLLLVNLQEPEHIDTQLIFHEPRTFTANGYLQISPEVHSKTTVTWGFKGTLRFPIQRFQGIFLERMLNPHLEMGLRNLKNTIESQVAPSKEDDLYWDEDEDL